MNRMHKVCLGVAAVLATAFLSAAPAVLADTIGPGSCNSCLGNAYTLTSSNIAVGKSTTSLDVTLTIDTSTFNGFGTGKVGDLNATAVKIVTGSSSVIDSATLLSAPGGIGDWTTLVGDESSAGCNSGNAGFICSQANFPNEVEVDADTGGPLTFEWLVTVNNGGLALGTLESHVKAGFLPENGIDEHGKPMTSENITLSPFSAPPDPTSATPEPSAMLLLGSGLLGLGRMIRRRPTA